MKRFKEFIQEENGKLSVTRLMFFLWGLGVLAVWIFACVSSKTIHPIDSTVITLIGVFLTGKVVQRFGENSDIPPKL